MSSDQHLEKGTLVPGDRLEALNRAILDSALDCIIIMDAMGVFSSSILRPSASSGLVATKQLVRR